MNEPTLKKFVVKRPNGDTFYQLHFRSTDAILVGTLWIEEGMLRMRSSVNYTNDEGSLVKPDGHWIGDLNYSIKGD